MFNNRALIIIVSIVAYALLKRFEYWQQIIIICCKFFQIESSILKTIQIDYTRTALC